MTMKQNLRFLLAIFILILTYNLHKQQLRHETQVRRNEKNVWHISTTRFNKIPTEHRDTTTPTVSMDWEDMLTCTDNSSTGVPVTAEIVNDTAELELCPNLPPNLGQVGSGESMINIASIQSIYNELRIGGTFIGKQCKARQAVGIIVPFNGQKKHLNPFLYYMHPFLMKQQLDYRIFVIQYNNSNNSLTMNRGQLFNIGVKEAEKFRPGGWDCLILHDADLLPLDLRNLYRCSWFPRKMIAVINNRSAMRKTDDRLSGGAISITPELFKKINGFSNQFLDRDVCYEDFYYRLTQANLIIEKNCKLLGSYRIMKYVRFNKTATGIFGNRKNFYYLTTSKGSDPRNDGMNTTAYLVNSIKELFFYTSINVTVYPNYNDMVEAKTKALPQNSTLSDKTILITNNDDETNELLDAARDNSILY